jgi:hypothetical protein
MARGLEERGSVEGTPTEHDEAGRPPAERGGRPLEREFLPDGSVFPYKAQRRFCVFESSAPRVDGSEGISRCGRRVGVAVGCAAALFALTRAEPVLAQSRRVGSDYISRPLVLPVGVLRLDGGPRRPYSGGQVMPGGQLQFLINEGEDVAFLVPGAGYGVVDNLELGAVWPLLISPDLDLSDLSVYGKYSLQRGNIEVAGYAELRIPIENDLELTGGVPVFLHLSEQARIETGGFVRFTFGDDTAATVHVPVSVPILVSPEVFVGPEIGVEIRDFSDVAVPVGVIAGYTLGGSISSIGDLFARLTFADIGSGADLIRFDIGAEIFFDVM